MTRIRFEDLPSTNTPRNAENLNKLNNVVISKDTPTTGEEVWIKKGKNLFDSSTIVTGDIIGANNDIRLSSRQNLWLESGTYTFSTNLSSDYQFSVSINNVSKPPMSTYPEYIYNSSWHTVGTTKKTFTISNAGWFVLALRKADNTNITLSEITGFNYQLEGGSTATSYEAYIDKKIYTKNDNGVYEEFYNKDEQITYNVNIRGGGTYNIPTIKRYVDIYFTMTYLGGLLIKYTIDTEKTAFGSGITIGHDSNSGLEYYISECEIDGTALTHTRCGYINISTGAYTSREDNKDYYIYQIKTYD